MALQGVTTVDAMRGAYRSTTSLDEKMTWMQLVWSDPQVKAWCGETDTPDITYVPGTGMYRYGKSREGGDLTFWFGRQPMTDCDLAEAFGYGARRIGWPNGSRAASGPVHDPQMLMLTVMALWVHSPARAKELHHMYRELGLNVAVPAGGWDPSAWVIV